MLEIIKSPALCHSRERLAKFSSLGTEQHYTVNKRNKNENNRF